MFLLYDFERNDTFSNILLNEIRVFHELLNALAEEHLKAVVMQLQMRFYSEFENKKMMNSLKEDFARMTLKEYFALNFFQK